MLQRGAVRYTPAGIQALDLVLAHQSQAVEAGQPRQVALEIRAVAIGEIVRPLERLAVGSAFEAAGFLAAQRNGRGIVWHITELH
jgi:primosomal replication protein N